MLNFSQKWTSLPNDAYRPMLIDDTECSIAAVRYAQTIFSGYRPQ